MIRVVLRTNAIKARRCRVLALLALILCVDSLVATAILVGFVRLGAK